MLRLRKVISVLVLSAALLLPAVAAYASSYGFVYDFKYRLVSQTRTMTGQNIAIWCDSNRSGGGSDNYFTISLYRESGWFDA